METMSEEFKVIEEYIAMLLENELCFYCDEEMINNFPVLDIKAWDYPSRISNVIIETGRTEFANSYRILKRLTNHSCRSIEIFFYESLTCEEMESVLTQVDELEVYNYNFICRLQAAESLERAVAIMKGHFKMFRGFLYNAPENGLVEGGKGGWGNIFLLQGEFNYSSCGIVDHSYFCTNLEHLSEAQSYNTCLNRKLFIDKSGKIKNCPQMPKSFGDFHTTDLNVLLNNEEFTKVWSIKKEDVLVCKDCEFRDVCTDCRAFIEDPENIYSKPLKCGYNPYDNTWTNWWTDPSKRSSLKHYELTDH